MKIFNETFSDKIAEIIMENSQVFPTFRSIFNDLLEFKLHRTGLVKTDIKDQSPTLICSAIAIQNVKQFR